MKRYIVASGEQTGSITLPDDALYSGNILWDESVDGLIPPSAMADIRWLRRSGNSLVVDGALKTTVEAADTAKANQKNARAILLANLQAYDGTGNPNQVLLDLIAYLGIK